MDPGNDDLIAGSQFQLLRGGSHLSMLTHPDAFAEALFGFEYVLEMYKPAAKRRACTRREELHEAEDDVSSTVANQRLMKYVPSVSGWNNWSSTASLSVSMSVSMNSAWAT